MNAFIGRARFNKRYNGVGTLANRPAKSCTLQEVRCLLAAAVSGLHRLDH